MNYLKSGGFPHPPLSPSHVTGGGSLRDQWWVISVGPHVGPATFGMPPQGVGGGGGVAWVAPSQAFPKHREI